MRFLDVGPEPIQVTGYRGDDDSRRPDSPGGTAPVRSVSDFYAVTRYRCWPFAYSVVCLGAPLVILAAALRVAASVIGPDPAADAPEAGSFAGFCDTPAARAPLQNALTAAALHFTISHLVLTLACAFALGFALWSIRNVVAIHRGPVAEALGLAGTLALGWAVYVFAVPLFRPQAEHVFATLWNFALLSRPDPGFACLDAARRLAASFDAEAGWGVLFVAFASVALAAAAATLAYRFERRDIDGRWADTYVLRHKLKALMTLFVLGSLVLVASNIGLSAYADLSARVHNELLASKGGDAAPAAKTTDAAGKAAVADESAPEADGGEYATLRKTALNVIGALASLTLIGMFLPAFAGLSADIEMAGKTHADADARRAPETPPPPEEIVVVVDRRAGVGAAARLAPAPPPNVVAGYKTIAEWKATHGLALDFADVATAMAAAAAPLLSNGVFDVAKSILGVS